MEPWKFKEDDTRQFDQLPTFLIFCEDEVCEPIYFKYFETSKIKVNILGGHKSKTDQVIYVITHCLSESIMEDKDGSPSIKDDNTQVWCVFDRDQEETQLKINLGNTSFNESITIAENRGIKVAWSNDCFELWILLHFEDKDLENYSDRVSCYAKLTEIFNAHPNPCEDLTRAWQSENFGYKKDLKSKTNFRNIVRPEIIPNTQKAIDRAKILEKGYEEPSRSNHQKRPCTKVHHLVEELLRLGGKSEK